MGDILLRNNLGRGSLPRASAGGRLASERETAKPGGLAQHFAYAFAWKARCLPACSKKQSGMHASPKVGAIVQADPSNGLLVESKLRDNRMDEIVVPIYTYT